MAEIFDEWEQLNKKYENTAEQKLGPLKKINDLITTIIKRRIDMGLTQKQLAEQANLKQSAIARLESYKVKPSLETLVKVLYALELNIEVKAFEKIEDKTIYMQIQEPIIPRAIKVISKGIIYFDLPTLTEVKKQRWEKAAQQVPAEYRGIQSNFKKERMSNFANQRVH